MMTMMMIMMMGGLPEQALQEHELAEVLTGPRNALCRQYRKGFDMNDVRFHVTEAGVRAIARTAVKRGTGARGLRSIMEQLLLGAMFEVGFVLHFLLCFLLQFFLRFLLHFLLCFLLHFFLRFLLRFLLGFALLSPARAWGGPLEKK